jgi:NADP-dependent 3-hydroxy acid dehydrogenase YdfG
MKRKILDLVVVLTGASSGTERATALQFANKAPQLMKALIPFDRSSTWEAGEAQETYPFAV